MFTKTELKWGLIFSAAAFIWTCLEYVVGLQGRFIGWHSILTNLFAIPAVIIMVMAIVDKRRELGGKITFGQAFLCGLGVSLIVAVLSLPIQYLFHSFINPGYFESAIRYAVENNKATLEQARSYFSMKSYLIQAPLGAIIIGAITSVVIAFAIKKELRNI